MNVKNRYKCSKCDTEDVIEFEGFAPLHFIRCSACKNQSELIEENVTEKSNYLFTFWTKANRMTSVNYKFNPMLKFQHFKITKV